MEDNIQICWMTSPKFKILLFTFLPFLNWIPQRIISQALVPDCTSETKFDRPTHLD